MFKNVTTCRKIESLNLHSCLNTWAKSQWLWPNARKKQMRKTCSSLLSKVHAQPTLVCVHTSSIYYFSSVKRKSTARFMDRDKIRILQKIGAALFVCNCCKSRAACILKNNEYVGDVHC